jgi:glycosyltransferase involved in cell wall biosynthesis
MSEVLKVLYAGCLDSDPYFCLKQCDRIVVSGLRERGVNVRELQDDLPQGKIFRTLNRKVLYPALVAKTTNSPSFVLRPPTSGILHIGSQCYANLVPRAQRPISITCHDVAEHYFPQDLSAAQMRRWERRIARLQEVDLIFSVSQHTKNDLIKLLGIPADTIVVNYNGIEPVFRPLEKGVTEKSCPDIAKLKKDHFLILVTSADLYRKNLETLLEAVSVLRNRGVSAKLVKTGDPLITHHASRITQLDLTDSIYDVGYISQEKLVALHSLCDVLAFPSLYEGFGMPVVEAQRCGLPCVISNVSSLPEIGGDGALYHDPRDVDQLADQLKRVYEDKVLCAELREKGFKNAERFSWDKHVDTLLEGWESFLVTSH